VLGEEGPGGGAGVPVDEYGDMLPSLEMAAPPGAEKARPAVKVAKGFFLLPAGRRTWLVEGAVAREDEDLNRRGHHKTGDGWCEHDSSTLWSEKKWTMDSGIER